MVGPVTDPDQLVEHQTSRAVLMTEEEVAVAGVVGLTVVVQVRVAAVHFIDADVFHRATSSVAGFGNA